MAVYSPRDIASLGGIRGNIIQPRLFEGGKIKIGKLSDTVRKAASGREYRVPEKLDHFIVMRNERDESGQLVVDQAVMAQLGERPKELDITFLSNDIGSNFITYLGLYASRRCLCWGNGENAFRKPTHKEGGKTVVDDGPANPIACPCEFLEKGQCKPHGILSVQLAKSPVLGCIYKFRTTGMHSVSSIMASLELISLYTGGNLAGLPLLMTISPMTSDVVVNGALQTVTYHVVNVVYKGDSQALMAAATQMAERQLQCRVNLKRLDTLMLQAAQADTSADEADVQQEFFPESAELPAKS